MQYVNGVVRSRFCGALLHFSIHCEDFEPH
jgi:hypothetical protein